MMKAAALFHRGLVPLFCVSLVAGTSMGFFAPLLAQIMRGMGLGELPIGLVSMMYYACLAIAPTVWRLARDWPAHAAMTCGLVVSALATAVTPLCDSLATLALARAVAGLGTGIYMTAAQATLARVSEEQHRAKVFGLYGTMFALGLILGAVAGPALYGQSVWGAFLAAAGLLLAGAVLVVAAAPRVPLQLEVSSASVRRRGNLPLHAVLAYGFAESALLSLYPAFLLWKGESISTTGWACSAFVWGGALSTFAVAALGDRYGRVVALAFCTSLGCVAAGALTRADGTWAVLIGSTLVGAGFGPVYALSLAVLSERIHASELAAGSAAFTSAFALGCILGPMLTAACMYLFGAGAVFLPTIAIFASVVVRCLSSPSRPLALVLPGSEKSR